MTEHPSPDRILRIVKGILKNLRSAEAYTALAHAIECPRCRSVLLEGLLGRPAREPPDDGRAETTVHER